MKVAYLVSRYPAVSHTFIFREIQMLRKQGVQIETFSIRRAATTDVLGPEAKAEAMSTRWLVPPSPGGSLAALFWAATTRPLRLVRALSRAVFQQGMSMAERLRWMAYLAESLQLAHWLVRGNFDRLHTHFGNSASSTGLFASQLAGIPFSMTCHGSELNHPRRFRLADKVAASDFVACVSQYGKARLMLDSPPAHWEKIHVVRCGVPPATRLGGERHPEPNSILCVARLSVEKGHLILLEALAILRDSRIELTCVLVGDGPLRSQIETRIGELDLASCVKLAGALPPEEVAARYPAAEVVVLASFSEGVPVVLMEAMTYARPVVATSVGGVPELVKHESTGLIVPPGDARELADALRRVLTDKALARRLGERGAQTVKQVFDIEASAAQLADLFRGSTQVETARGSPNEE